MRAKENTHCHRLPPSCHYGSHCDDGLARPTGPRARPSPEPVLRTLFSPAKLREGQRPGVHTDPAVLLTPTYLGHCATATSRGSNVCSVTFVGTKRVLNTRWAGCWLSGSTETTVETLFTKTT